MSDLVGLPVFSDDEFLTREEFAQLLNVSTDTVDRMRKSGCPSVTWGRRTRRFPKRAGLAWAFSQEGN